MRRRRDGAHPTATLGDVSDAGLPPPPPSHGPASVPPPPPPPTSLPASGSAGTPAAFARVLPVARWTQIALAAVAVLQIVTLTLSWTVVDDAELLLDDRISESDFIARYAGVAVVSLLMAGVGVAVWVLAIVWMHRLAGNADRLGRRGRWTPGWAIGGWFCPPVLFVIPFLHLRQLWRSTDPRPGDAWHTGPVAPIVTVWWALYGLLPALLIPLGASVAFRGVGEGDGQDLARQIRDDLTLQTLSGALSVAAAVAFGLLVRQLSARQAAITGEATVRQVTA